MWSDDLSYRVIFTKRFVVPYNKVFCSTRFWKKKKKKKGKKKKEQKTIGKYTSDW